MCIGIAIINYVIGTPVWIYIKNYKLKKKTLCVGTCTI